MEYAGVAGKVETLWNLGWQCVSDMMRHFQSLYEAIGSGEKTRALERAYESMACFDLSSNLLTHAIERIAAVPLTGALWSDWGRPERIEDSLRRIGKTPRFSTELLGSPSG